MLLCVGDGAGVGKGRIIAGIIFQNYLEGRKKAIWYAVYGHEAILTGF